jgi:hypothetical protein
LGATVVFLPAARAAAPPSVSIGELARNSIEFYFRQGSYRVFVGMEGPGNRLSLEVAHAGATADYVTEPHFEGRRIRARFGRMGSLDMTFTPSPGKVHRCGSIVDAEGVFTGVLEFTGEHRYIHLDLHRIRGRHTTAGTCSSSRAALPPRPSRASIVPPEGREVILQARARGSRALDTVTATAGNGVRGFEAVVAAFHWEHRDGMEVIRGSQLGLGRRRFHWDLDAGTATLHPPAPFTGTATLGRGPDGSPRWRGNLRVPILGGAPLALSGSRFKVRLWEGSRFR